MSYCVYLYQVIKCLRFNRYNFQTVGAIDFLFSTLHRTSFLFGAIDSGVLHQLHASVATSDTPLGFTPVISFCRILQFTSNLVCT